jgi:(p)ppGpp synthase/HD superfamily hydrolase
MARTDFVERSPLTRGALGFAERHHSGQKRAIDGEIPLVTHPIEVACLLHEAGYPDEVVAAGVLHDVLEETRADATQLEEHFGAEVARLVAAVSDDPSIDDDRERKAALRRQVAEADERTAAVFAADKVSKARELHARVSRRGRFGQGDRDKLEHYDASLGMLTGRIPGHALLDQLRAEVAALHSLPAPGA